MTGSGSGSGQGDQEAPTAPKIIGQEEPVTTKDRVREIIREEVVEIVWSQIPELFGTIKSAMMEYFDDRYATLDETDTLQLPRLLQQQEGDELVGASSTGTSITRSPRHLMASRILS